MPLEYQIGQGYHALDAQARRDRLDGYAVASGLGVSPGTGLEVDVASGTATVGETSGTVDTVNVAATTVALDTAASTNPRKDTVYVDESGTVQVETGVADSVLPSANTRFNTYQPEPPLPSTNGAILAEVFVAAGATSLGTDDIRDRREPADVVTDRMVAQSASIDETNITNETLIRLEKTTDQSYSSGGSSPVQWDNIPKDERSEYNSTDDTFSVDAAGWYKIEATFTIVQASEGDRLDVRLIDSSDDSIIEKTPSGGFATDVNGRGYLSWAMTLPLDSSVDYYVYPNNPDSSYTVEGRQGTRMTIRSAFREETV